jgi:hypothetical protein
VVKWAGDLLQNSIYATNFIYKNPISFHQLGEGCCLSNGTGGVAEMRDSSAGRPALYASELESNAIKA